MSAPSSPLSETGFEPRAAEPAAPSRTRPFYWSVWRELWENRAFYVAPLIAAAVVLVGVVISVVHPPHLAIEASRMSRGRHALPAIAPYAIAAVVIVVTGLIVGFFYCLGALHGERRDRSILFWKSLPVSDLTTVLSKAFLPLVVLPLVTFAVVAATQLVMLVLNTAGLALQGQDAWALWDQVQLPRIWVALLYAMVTLSLWYAPIWGWLLLVSAWAKRMTFLWGVGPPLAVCVVERLAFDTTHALSLLQYRLTGSFEEAFTPQLHGQGLNDPHMDPLRFLAAPGLWLGLVFAAAFLAGAIWLRRRREPI